MFYLDKITKQEKRARSSLTYVFEQMTNNLGCLKLPNKKIFQSEKKNNQKKKTTTRMAKNMNKCFQHLNDYKEL